MEVCAKTNGDVATVSDELRASLASTMSSIACPKPLRTGDTEDFKAARSRLGTDLRVLTDSSFEQATPIRINQLQSLCNKVGAVFKANSEDWPSHDTARTLVARSAQLGSFGHFSSSAGLEVYGDPAYKELRSNLSEEIAFLEGRTAQAAELKEAVELAIKIDKDRISTESFDADTERLTNRLSNTTV
jgi:hypothetical protein